MSTRRRAWLIAEMLLLYGGVPLAAYVLAVRHTIPLVVIIAPALLVFPLLLSFDRGFSWRALLSRSVPREEWRSILLLFLPVGTLIVLATAWFRPELFLIFVRERPALWAVVLVVYPLISVQGQEIIWRVFFFRRYEALFAGRPGRAIVVNALLFAFAHIIFQNGLAIAMTFAGGLLFAWRYRRGGSYWAVTLEHSLYGDLIFTCGLGRYFYLDVMRASAGM